MGAHKRRGVQKRLIDMNYVQLTSKDLKRLKEGKSIQITIDGKARVNLRHCDCDICTKYSDQYHKVVEPSGELDERDAGSFPPFVQNNQHDRR